MPESEIARLKVVFRKEFGFGDTDNILDVTIVHLASKGISSSSNSLFLLHSSMALIIGAELSF